MRTAQICPTCAVYTNALCVIYDGPFLTNSGISPMDNLEDALGLIDGQLGVLASSILSSAITLTTTGTSGPATLIGSALNIPNYAPTFQAVLTNGNTTTTGITFKTGVNTNTATIDSLLLTGNQTYQLPNASGTIALQSYKVYSALISQTGTSAPTVVALLENTIGTITFSYTGVGQYRINSSGLFTIGKTCINGNSIGNNADTIFYSIGNTNYCSINTRNLSGTTTNDVLSFHFIEVRVYP